MQTETKQVSFADEVVAEMEQEAVTTKRLFEILPEDKLDWRPHPKAKSLAELAMHVARIPGAVAELGNRQSAQASDIKPDPTPTSRAEILETFAASLKTAKDIVRSTSAADIYSDWALMDGDKQLLITMSRKAFWRTVLLNHNYHHRGQLSTYLRQLDIPLPSIYGPSADTNPFG